VNRLAERARHRQHWQLIATPRRKTMTFEHRDSRSTITFDLRHRFAFPPFCLWCGTAAGSGCSVLGSGSGRRAQLALELLGCQGSGSGLTEGRGHKAEKATPGFPWAAFLHDERVGMTT
jgi:hypothetical protein